MSDFRMISDAPVNLAGGNVPVTETRWVAGTYDKGTKRYVDTDLYEVTADPGTSDKPLDGIKKEPPTWVRIGKINRWKMFSESIAEKTVAPSPVEVVLDVPATTNSIALFGVTGAGSVVVTTLSGGKETGTTALSFTNSEKINNWFDYFFAPVEQAEEIVSFDLPGYGSDQLKIRLEGTGEIQVGKLIVGEAVTIGRSLLGYTAGFEDFSRKERDVFGGFTILERRYSKTLDMPVMIQSNRIDAVLRAFARVRAKPTVYVGDPNVPETIVIGFFKDIQILRVTDGWGETNIELEAIT